MYRDLVQRLETAHLLMRYLLNSSSIANDVSVVSVVFPLWLFACANCSFDSLASEQQAQGLWTWNQEPFEQRGDDGPSPNRPCGDETHQLPDSRYEATQAPKHSLCISIIKHTSDCSSFANEIFMRLIITLLRLMQTRLWKQSSASQPTCTWQLQIKMAAAQVVQSVLSHAWVTTVWQNRIISARPHSTCQAEDSTSEQTDMTEICLTAVKCIWGGLNGQIYISKDELWVNCDCVWRHQLCPHQHSQLKPHCEVTTWFLPLHTPRRVRSNNTAASVVAPGRRCFAVHFSLLCFCGCSL